MRHRPRLLRVVIAVVAAVLVVLLAAVAGIAWYFSGIALAVDHSEDYPLVAQPDGAGAAVRLSPRAPDALLAGTYGLRWAGGYTRVGAVTAQDAAGVTRALQQGAPPGPPAGTHVGLDPDSYVGDPKSALGLDFEQVSIATDLGAAPAWYVPVARPATGSAPGTAGSVTGERGTWAVFVHGHDSSRLESLRYLRALHAIAMPVLVPTYRNDVGAPASPDGFDHLGDTEWRDVEAAVRFALARGAANVVLFGWSMGGAIVLQLADRSPLANRVAGLVLDSPVLDWRAVLHHQGSDRGLPSPLTALAIETISRRAGIDFDRFDWVTRAKALTEPTLLFHSDDDGYVPDGPSRQLAALRPDLITADFVPGADHTRAWNVDPVAYERVLTGWLARIRSH